MAAKSLKAVLVVLSNCTDPARENEFKAWYANIHLPDVLETPGIIDAKFFGLATPPKDGQSNFLAIYELDTDDVAAVQKSLDEVMGPKREQGRLIDYIQVSAQGYYT